LHQPAMLHRAILGSLERFIGIYIEHTGGDFPFWLSPIQVVILPISDRHQERAHELKAALASKRVRAEVDDRSETLGFRVREGQTQKIPLTLVIGDDEVERGTVSPRLRKSKQAMDAMSAEALVEALSISNAERRKFPFA
jgi:threonyl-tRNA synthetase